MSDDPTRPWHLPYEDVPGGPIDIDAQFLMVDGVTVRAATVPLPAPVGRMPLLLIDFTNSAASDVRLPTVGLVGSPEVLLNFAEVVRQSVRAALREHRRLEGGN